MSFTIYLSLALPPLQSDKNVIYSVGLIPNLIVLWCFYSDQVHAWLISDFILISLSINTSAQSSITRYFLQPALIKTPGKLLRTASCGSQVISTWHKSLLSALIHVVKILDESVGEIPNLSAISLLSKPNHSRINVRKNSSLMRQFSFKLMILVLPQFTVWFLLTTHSIWPNPIRNTRKIRFY